MNNLLLVTNVLPEENSGRAAKFSVRQDMLAERGWNVHFAKISPPYTMHLPGARDLTRCCRKLKQHDINVINSVSEPPQLHLAGYFLHRLTGIPWLVEFRDPLVTKPGRDESSMTMRIRRRFEEFLLWNATQVVWDDGIQLPENYFTETYPDVPSRRYHKLPFIGVNWDVFDSASQERFETQTITYAGSWYDGWIEPDPFLRGLAAYCSRDDVGNVKTRIYGDWRERHQQAATNAGVADKIVSNGWIPHEDVVPILKGSDLLLYVGGTDGRNAINIPAKLYDYIGARVPILAIIDPTFRAANVIRKYDLGFVAHPDDTVAIADAIETALEDSYTYSPDSRVRNAFSRARKMDEFAAVINAVKSGRMFNPDTQ
jgi:glycosyltransferase involved in cell wall biosynthesis